jgi:hypothetical protein
MRFRRAGHPAAEYHPLIVAALHKFGQQHVRADARTGEVVVGQLGSITLDDAQLERLRGLTPGQLVPALEAVVVMFLRKRQPPLPASYDGVPDEYRSRLQENLFQISLRPQGALSHHQVANLERALGIEGWRERLLLAARLAERRAAETGGLEMLRQAATCYWEAGESIEATRCAEIVLGRIERRVSTKNLLNPDSWVICEALIIAGRSDELPSLIDEFGQAQLGPDWWPVCQGAAAAERGDLEGLRREVEAAERSSADEPLDAAGYGPTGRDRAAEMRRWLGTSSGSAQDPPPGSRDPSMAAAAVRVIGPIPEIGARRVTWDRTGAMAITLTADNRLIGLSAESDVWERACTGTHELKWAPGAALLTVLGESLLVDAGGAARAAPDGGRLALSHSGELLSIHHESGVVDIIDRSGLLRSTANGSSVAWSPCRDEALVVDEDGVQLMTASSRQLLVPDNGERADLSACWSPAGEHLAVWGSYGQFDLHARDGTLLSSFPAHLRDPNLAADLGATLMATAGADGHVVVYDLVRSAVAARLDVAEIPTRVALDPTQQYVLTIDTARSVQVWDVETARRVGPARPTTFAVWHPSNSTLACCDGEAMWLEVYPGASGG